jgi:tetratricopeptide (TPR) repeat protein
MPFNYSEPKTELNSSKHPLSSPGKKNFVLCLLLTAIALVAYNRAAANDFINFDDPEYVLNNVHLRAGTSWETVKWAFTTFEAANWHPLTWLSHALDYRLFQLNPAGHHYVNVLFHSANAVLLFLLLVTATRRTWPSWMVAALWAVHPINVESVAWISERKNVLSMFFFLLAMLAYGKYVQKPKLSSYFTVAIAFALGLMAKPQIITFPFLLLLWDYWPLKRLENPGLSQSRPSTLSWLALEKLPLLLLSAGSALITIKAQALGNAVRTTSEFPLSSRVGNALVSYVRYIELAFWPARLSPVYPHPEGSLPVWQPLSAALLLGAITVFVLWHRQKRYLLVGWLWFLGALVPMIGLLQVGQQAMADRYAYLPFIGLFIMVVWGVAELCGQRRISPAVIAPGFAAVLITLGAVTYHQLGYWRNSEVLWTRALEVTSKNYTAHRNLADTLARQGRSEEAIAHYEASARLHVYPAGEVLTLGMYEQQNGHIAGAIEQFKKVLRSPDDGLRGSANDYLGAAYMQLGKNDLAGESYADALQINPNDAVALVGSGLLAYPGNPEFAAAQFSRAVSARPSDVGLLLLTAALQRIGRSQEAQLAYDRARELSQDFVQAQRTVDQLLGSHHGVSN